MKYNCTAELNTPLWKKALRWLRILKKREEFILEFGGDYFDNNYIVHTGLGGKIKIISRYE